MGFAAHVLRTREPLVINEGIEEATKKYGSFTIPGTRTKNRRYSCRWSRGDQARGLINLFDMENGKRLLRVGRTAAADRSPTA